MIITIFASSHMFHKVRCWFFLTILVFNLNTFLDVRGITQEVSLITKHGVEAKNYEGVSI